MKNRQRRENVRTEYIEYERAKNELTFEPNKGLNRNLPERRQGYMAPLDRQAKQQYDEEYSPQQDDQNSPLGQQTPRNDQFWINVKLGYQTKTIMATLESDPARLAKNFLRANSFDLTQAETLEKIIA